MTKIRQQMLCKAARWALCDVTLIEQEADAL